MNHAIGWPVALAPGGSLVRHWRLLGLLLVGFGCGSATPLNDQCLYDGRRHGVGESFPSADGCNICSCTSMGVACTERACLPDASTTLDSGGDAKTPDDATTTTDASDLPTPSADGASIDGASTDTCALDRSYAFWDDGGLVAYADRSTLMPPRTHTLSRDHFRNALPNSCSRALACNGSAGVDLGEFVQALGNADVVAALALPMKPFYGTDTRPVDGTVFIFERDDQRGFMLGAGDVPAGLRTLQTLLRQLQSETVASLPCAGL
jgi:hypothetical protein